MQNDRFFFIFFVKKHTSKTYGLSTDYFIKVIDPDLLRLSPLQV